MNIHDTSIPRRPLWADSDIGSLKDIGQGEGNLTENELLNVLRRYNLRDGLIVFGKASTLAFNDKSENRIGKATVREPSTGVFVTQFGLAYLANALILSGANDYKSKQIGEKENLLTLLNIYSNDLIFPEAHRDRSLPFTDKDMVSSMVRLSAEQFEYQFDFVHIIARTMIIFREIINTIPPHKFEPLDTIFERETKLNFSEYFVLAMAVWAVSQETSTFRKGSLTEGKIPSMQENLTDEKVTNFLNILSADYETFRAVDKEANVNLQPVFTKYRFNPLLIYPIIKTDRTETDPYIVPCTLSFLKRAFGGLYWWFHRYFESTGHQLDFRDYYGEVYEQYVGKILKEAYGEENVHPEIEYPKGKFIDWWVEKDSTIYFFEAKAYQFALLTKQTGDYELLIKEVKSKIIKSIKQVFERMQEIDKYEELSVFRDKKIVPVIVFMEIPLASSHLYKKLIEDELLELEQNGLVGIKDSKIHFLNIEELEYYSSGVGKVPLEEVFAGYESNPSEGFVSILQKKIGTHANNDYLDKVYKDYWNEMTGGAPEDDF